MYQGKSMHSPSQMSIPPERQLFLQGGNGPGDSGLVLSTDAKPRLKWTQDLHERFIEAVNQLGGADKATPKTVMKFMGIPGLTLYHLKSHLQKYRLSKNIHGQVNNGINKTGSVGAMVERMPEESRTRISSPSVGSQTSKNIHISEALQMQIEVQRSLHEQLEVQRHLQLRIEAQGKYLQAVLEKAQETLGRQNLGKEGLEATKIQLSELVSNVSTQCFNSTFSDLKGLQSLHHKESERGQDMSLRPYNFDASFEVKEIADESRIHESEDHWRDDLKENIILENRAEKKMFSVGKKYGDLSMSISLDEEKAKSFSIENYRRVPYFEAKLDLNSNHENDSAPTSRKQFDLNGFSW